MNAFSFGVSRDNMKKIHIQAIEKVAMEKLPAPNAYSVAGTFGKVGPHYSLRADTSRTESNEMLINFHSDETHLKEGAVTRSRLIQQD
jgi:hypothetical protein